MEFRLYVDGDPVTEWERVSARDVDLWKSSIRTNLRIDKDAQIEVRSRKVDPDRARDVAAYASGPPTLAMSKDELRSIADGLDLDVPSGATKAQLVDLIRGV